jgi:hypothetical protein
MGEQVRFGGQRNHDCAIAASTEMGIQSKGRILP